MKTNFESIIDNYILEEVTKGEANEDILKAKLRKYDNKNKRLTMLSLLDSDRMLFKEIKATSYFFKLF